MVNELYKYAKQPFVELTNNGFLMHKDKSFSLQYEHHIHTMIQVSLSTLIIYVFF